MDKKRARGDNWTAEEKKIFIEIMKGSSYIIENKKTDTNSNKRKEAEWLKVKNKYQELTNKKRDIQKLKGFWRRMKIAAKKNISSHKKALRATGGAQKPPSPSDEIQSIMEMCPIDFIDEKNEFDVIASHKSKIVEHNIKLKEKTFELMEEEYRLKILYQQKELFHQEERHKLELEALQKENEKKNLEIKILKKTLSL